LARHPACSANIIPGEVREDVSGRIAVDQVMNDLHANLYENFGLKRDAKNPANFLPGLDSTWTIFRWLLSRATHVLVLGHSLTDKHLVDALKGWSGPHLAFVKYQDCSDDNYDPPTADEVEHYARIVGRTVRVIPGKFGRGTQFYDFDLGLMQDWSSRQLNIVSHHLLSGGLFNL
jgi:hypothetical protein